MIDNRTVRYNLPLPNAANFLNEDVGRLIQALNGLDGLLYTAATQLAQATDTQTHWADSTAITYDDQGRVATITETYGASEYVITVGYAGDLVARVQTDGNGRRRTETLSYDENDRLIGVDAEESAL